MYVTAHRVARDNTPDTGVNAFCYLHGASLFEVDAAWTDERMDEVVFGNPGTLARQYTSIQPGGNRVMSYLDVIAADHTPVAVLARALDAFKDEIGSDQIPMTRVIGSVGIRFGLCVGLAGQERLEFDVLRRVLVMVASVGEGDPGRALRVDPPTG